jgi:hypothetical protein
MENVDIKEVNDDLHYKARRAKENKREPGIRCFTNTEVEVVSLTCATKTTRLGVARTRLHAFDFSGCAAFHIAAYFAQILI